MQLLFNFGNKLIFIVIVIVIVNAGNISFWWRHHAILGDYVIV